MECAATWICLAAISGTLASGPLRQEWASRYDGGETDIPAAMALGGKGKVYVAGMSQRSFYWDLATLAYDRDGRLLWVQRFQTGERGENTVRGLGVDGRGNVFVAGTVVTARRDTDYLLLKYDPDGRLLWSVQYNGPGEPRRQDDRAFAVVVDAGGNAYISGVSMDAQGISEYATLKYDAGGQLLWLARYNDGLNDQLGAWVRLVLDPEGGVYLAAHGIRILRYAADGRLLFSSKPAGGSLAGVALDPRGGIVVAGSQSDPGSGNTAFLTARIDANGTPLWSQTYLGADQDEAEARAVAVDRDGNVCVTGWTQSGDGIHRTVDYQTIKYGPDGTLLWQAKAGTPGTAEEFALDYGTGVAVDGGGFAYVTGQSQVPVEGYGIVTILYAPDGRALGEARYDGSDTGYDVEPEIALDGVRTVYIAARSEREETGADFALNYLFRHGDGPADPFAACGFDLTPDSLECAGYPPCP